MKRPNFNCIKYDTQTEIEDIRLYLKDLNDYCTYLENQNKQLRIGGVVGSAVKKTKTVWLDDTWYRIEIDGLDTKSGNRYEFAEIVDILLTPKQKQEFIENNTSREFEVSQKRIDKMFTYINSDNNIWRKK
jgi:hypothetical protein